MVDSEERGSKGGAKWTALRGEGLSGRGSWGTV